MRGSANIQNITITTKIRLSTFKIDKAKHSNSSIGQYSYQPECALRTLGSNKNQHSTLLKSNLIGYKSMANWK
jgi:hypothetical protein